MEDFSVRTEISRLIGKTGNSDRISEVNNWTTIQAKIEETFIKKKHHAQSLHKCWLRFKEPEYSWKPAQPAFLAFRSLIHDDRVWLMVEDHEEKMWLYEGETAFILDELIPNLSRLGEYYLISKKGDWILCENHHEIVCGSGRIQGLDAAPES